MIQEEKAIRAIVKSSVEGYAAGFEKRHLEEKDDPNGTINMKIHNVFIAALGPEIQYYSALARSLDSSLGNMLETMAINIAQLFYTVAQSVEGVLYPAQTTQIATLLENYKSHRQKPQIIDYKNLANHRNGVASHKVHISDYYLLDKETNQHYLIELKIGGDLDNKKARAEKEAILEQYAILANRLETIQNIHIYFATAYNRFGENQPWKQERVRQFFAEEELLIGKDFWNFICKTPQGYDIVLSEYTKYAPVILHALNSIKKKYLG